MKSNEKLRARWSHKENDLVVNFPSGISTITDANFLITVFSKEVLKSLIDRGYDIKTIKFSIEPKKDFPKFST